MTLLLLSLLVAVSRAQEEKKTLYLPKNPVAAAYVLSRLSNKELVEAPRSEFVYVALLQRKGLDRKYRLEALEGLAKLRNSDTVSELIGAIAGLDKKGEETEAVIRDLAGLLIQRKAEDLAAKREALTKLAEDSQLPSSRQAAFAAIVQADGSVDKIWGATAPEKWPDLILASEFLKPAARASFESKVRPLVSKADAPEIQKAAIQAVSGLLGKEAETFESLTELLQKGTEKEAVVASLQRIPKKFWSKTKAETLLPILTEQFQKADPAERAEEPFANAVQFATDLASTLPPEKAVPIQKTLRSLGTTVFLVRTIYEQMLYDKAQLVVQAGKTVQIILQNDDSMPHNLVLIAPGSIEEVGTAAEKMPPEPNSQGKHYMPESPKVLTGTKLVDPGHRDKISFTAPSELGEYPYLCTFPGHWRRMVGNLVVVKDVDEYFATHSAPAEPKLTEWKVSDLTADLPKVSAGRNVTQGKDLFTKLACAQCHKLGVEGVAYGPELTDVFKRYKNDRAEVLRQILEPSAVIADRYRNFQFALKDGEEVSGMILKEDASTVTAQSGPSDALIQTFQKSTIKERHPQPSSLMPVGLLNSLSKDEILDLLAFIETSGEAHHH